MIEAAAESGADAVKFQTIDPDANYARGTPSHDLFSKAALKREETAELFSLAREKGLCPFTTVGDLATLDWVDQLDPSVWKISSGLLTASPIIAHAAKTGRPLLISTGMAVVKEIDDAVETARNNGSNEIGLFQCTALYPAPKETLNLSAIGWLEQRYNLPVGFSDHSEGTEAAALSVAAGSCMIEKHFTLDRTRPGYDHAVSLDPSGFQKMTEAIRRAESMRGKAEKQPSVSEREKAVMSRRQLGAIRDISSGETISTMNTGFLRFPGGVVGLQPDAFDRVLGRTTKKNIEMHQPLNEKDLT